MKFPTPKQFVATRQTLVWGRQGGLDKWHAFLLPQGAILPLRTKAVCKRSVIILEESATVPENACRTCLKWLHGATGRKGR